MIIGVPKEIKAEENRVAINVYLALLTNNEVAKAFGLDYVAYAPA